MDSLFKRIGINVDYEIESANSATIKQMVLAGMGLGVLPDFAVTPELRRRELVRIEVPLLTMSQQMMLYFGKNRTLSATRVEFVDYLQAFFKTATQRPRRTASESTS